MVRRELERLPPLRVALVPDKVRVVAAERLAEDGDDLDAQLARADVGGDGAADLLGLPVRVVVSARNLRQDVIEIQRRNETDGTTVHPDQAVGMVKVLTDC